jgi:PAS domain S-box-containing protein
MANPAAAKLFGYGKNKLVGLSIEELIPAGKRKGHTRMRKEYLKNPSPRSMGMGRDLEGLKKSGKRFPIEISLSYTKFNREQVVISFIIDITHRKKIEEELKAEKETAQMYLDVAGAIFLVLDLKGRITLINQTGCKLLGYPESHVLGKNLFDHFVPKVRKDKLREIFKRLIARKNQLYDFEEFIVDKNQEKKLIAWNVTLIEDDKKNPVSLLCSGIDITDRKRAELALKRSEEKLIVYATELEKRVGERTRELAQAIKNLEELNQDLQEEIKIRKKAEEEVRKSFQKERELSELKSRFVSLASHEFRPPLSTIMSSVSLIARYEKESDKEKRLKHVNRIKNNVTNLTGLLNDFLDLEKLEEGRLVPVYEEFDFHRFIVEVRDEMQAISKKGQSIILISEDNISTVRLDEQMLKNICFNLLSNAIKYSHEEGTIKFIYRRENDNLVLIVKDEGIGIPKSEQHNLFLRFFRAKNASGIQGTGLGLYIVKKYVEEMKGSITFTSEIEKGSTFKIQLPLKHDKGSAN